MIVNLNSEKLPLCPDCWKVLLPENPGRRETCTPGGYSIEYLICEKCESRWELVNRESVYRLTTDK
jgi:hypothetical protein